MKYVSKWAAVPLLAVTIMIVLVGRTLVGSVGDQKEEYWLTGTGTHQELAVGDAKEPVVIHMKELQLTGSEAPVLKILGSADVMLVLEGENILQAVTPETDQIQPVLRTEGSLTICGEGSLAVSGMYQDGIRVKNNFSMSSGTLSVEAGNNGIRSGNEIAVSGGILTVRAGNNGIKAKGKQQEENGQIKISGGELHVAAGDDALEAEALVRISGGSVFLDAEDYLIHCDGEQELARDCVFYEKQ